MRPTGLTYVLYLRALPQADDPGGVRRLRMALKVLLRQFKLRCVSVEPADETRHCMRGPSGRYQTSRQPVGARLIQSYAAEFRPKRSTRREMAEEANSAAPR
jgi:hypothetical protein